MRQGTECVTDQKNHACVSSAAGVNANELQGREVCKVAHKCVGVEGFSFLCRFCKELRPLSRQGTGITLIVIFSSNKSSSAT